MNVCFQVLRGGYNGHTTYNALTRLRIFSRSRCHAESKRKRYKDVGGKEKIGAMYEGMKLREPMRGFFEMEMGDVYA